MSSNSKGSSGGSKGRGGRRQTFTRVKTARGRKKSSTQWLQRQLNDPYVMQAREEGYRSRAAYKLLEINEKFSLIKQGDVVVDLGAAPGGWLQVAVNLTKSSSNQPTIVGIDLQEIEPIAGTSLIQADFLSEEAEGQLEQALEGRSVDVVLSDMAAASTGHTATDHIRIIALCEAAYAFAEENLQQGGHFAAKILKGGTEHELLTILKRSFKSVKHFKPPSSRKDSSESYVVAMHFKGKSATDS